ncbi:MAG: YnbE family lipoprotein [Akkermansiaceae bacterium]|nr:YnbE family lipoprotein [Akkermansiaceae bacterium]
MKVPYCFPLFATFAAVSGFTSCAKVKVEPIEVKPIEINVNVRVTVQKELDNFFGDLDAKEQKIAN